MTSNPAKLKEALEVIENRIEDQIDLLNNLKSDDLLELRNQRLKFLQEKEENKKNWRRLGHGSVCELQDEKEFFQITKASEKCVILIYSDDFNGMEGQILQQHLKKIASKILELKIAIINSKHCQYLINKLNIFSTPAIILTRNNTIQEKIFSFDKNIITNLNSQSTDMLLYRLSANGFIENEDLIPNTDPQMVQKSIVNQRRKTIRRHETDSEDSELEV
ncbi:thioredoxin domain-containing protein 9 homolog [Chrysoperla carnea]|uniref:thioredoxin domain-containing protein 9 homolog n=1 Tax=Chrysoperla carnea TaxID=189513 RepID=UPI001D07E6B4|nr:thioredoxin domain-containing protein 9 homolog [Chrysoperla carnea]